MNFVNGVVVVAFSMFLLADVIYGIDCVMETN